MDIRAERTYVSRAMKRFGGSFAVKLGQLIELADLQNTMKIKESFSELWEHYYEMAKCTESSLADEEERRDRRAKENTQPLTEGEKEAYAYEMKARDEEYKEE